MDSKRSIERIIFCLVLIALAHLSRPPLTTVFLGIGLWIAVVGLLQLIVKEPHA